MLNLWIKGAAFLKYLSRLKRINVAVERTDAEDRATIDLQNIERLPCLPELPAIVIPVSKFILDHGDPLFVRVAAEKMVEQRRFAAAEKAGHEIKRDRFHWSSFNHSLITDTNGIVPSDLILYLAVTTAGVEETP